LVGNVGKNGPQNDVFLSVEYEINVMLSSNKHGTFRKSFLLSQKSTTNRTTILLNRAYNIIGRLVYAQGRTRLVKSGKSAHSFWTASKCWLKWSGN